jgi:epidermal growth factor receptor substrate 15
MAADEAPNLNLSPEEKRTYGQLFRQADSESVGVVVGEIAVRFFHKTGLDSRILGEVRPKYCLTIQLRLTYTR